MSEQFIIDVQWDKPDLPRYIGPFSTREEATEWGVLSIPNGTWNIAPLTAPYLPSSTSVQEDPDAT